MFITCARSVARQWRAMLGLAVLLGASLGAFALTSSNTSAQEQIVPRYITLADVPGSVNAALYEPAGDTPPRVGVVVMHRTSNFLSHVSTTELARRGFAVLAINPRSINNEAAVDFERNALDMKAGVQFLRSKAGISKVLLLGHSGGGPASAFYQAVAEHGIGYCQGPRKVTECPDSLAGLPPVDGIILADAHPGIGINALRSLNPAVRNEQRPDRGYDRRLDPFSTANGYDPKGSSTYSEPFKHRYWKAQSKRMNALIEKAQARVRAVEKGRSHLTDDEPFTVYKGDAARLTEMDLSVHASTAKPQKVLKNDGSVSKEIGKSVRAPQPLKADNATLADGTMALTARSFLSGRAIRSRDSMEEIEFCSSNNSTRCGLEHASVPLLVMAMGGYVFVRDNEELYEHAASKDKDFVLVDGATHGMTPCTECETQPGQYSNATTNTFDYMADWIDARF